MARDIQNDLKVMSEDAAKNLISEFKSGAIDLRRIKQRRRYFADVLASDGIASIVRNRARIQYLGAKTAYERLTKSESS